jgi:hypothetical protein
VLVALVGVLATLASTPSWEERVSGIADLALPGLEQACPEGLDVRRGIPEEWGAETGASGWAWTGVCQVYVNRRYRHLRAWAPYCSVVLHEAEHVLGRDHSADLPAYNVYVRQEARIGNRRIVRWEGTDPRCATSPRLTSTTSSGTSGLGAATTDRTASAQGHAQR